MKNINKDIENQQMKQFYLLYGEEDYLKKQYRDKIVSAFVETKDDMNYSYFEGNTIAVQKVLEEGETLPFFAQNRVIVLENSNWFDKFPKELEKEIISEFDKDGKKRARPVKETYIALERLPESTHIVFVESKIDKRSKFYKWIEKNGYASEMRTPDEKMLTAWIQGLCKAEKKQMEAEALSYFVEHVGMDKTNMLLMKNELEKLFLYCCDEEVITKNAVREICVSQATDKMFEMLDAIGRGNQERAFQLYHDFLALKESPMRVHVMLSRHFRILMKIRGFMECDMDHKTMAANCGIPPFSIKKYIIQAEQYTYERLKNMVEQCQDIEYKIKTGQIRDIVGVELLIIEFSSHV